MLPLRGQILTARGDLIEYQDRFCLPKNPLARMFCGHLWLSKGESCREDDLVRAGMREISLTSHLSNGNRTKSASDA